MIHTQLGTSFADGDLNGVVNFDDFVLITNHFEATGTGWAQGNYNLDEVTNFDDFVILTNHFEMMAPWVSQSPAQDEAVVPVLSAPVSVPGGDARLGPDQTTISDPDVFVQASSTEDADRAIEASPPQPIIHSDQSPTSGDIDVENTSVHAGAYRDLIDTLIISGGESVLQPMGPVEPQTLPSLQNDIGLGA